MVPPCTASCLLQCSLTLYSPLPPSSFVPWPLVPLHANRWGELQSRFPGRCPGHADDPAQGWRQRSQRRGGGCAGCLRARLSADRRRRRTGSGFGWLLCCCVVGCYGLLWVVVGCCEWLLWVVVGCCGLLLLLGRTSRNGREPMATGICGLAVAALNAFPDLPACAECPWRMSPCPSPRGKNHRVHSNYNFPPVCFLMDPDGHPVANQRRGPNAAGEAGGGCRWGRRLCPVARPHPGGSVEHDRVQHPAPHCDADRRRRTAGVYATVALPLRARRQRASVIMPHLSLISLSFPCLLAPSAVTSKLNGGATGAGSAAYPPANGGGRRKGPPKPSIDVASSSDFAAPQKKISDAAMTLIELSTPPGEKRSTAFPESGPSGCVGVPCDVPCVCVCVCACAPHVRVPMLGV